MPKRVLIVGAGVIGLCAAYYARKRGFDVTVMDSAARERTGTSFGNAGLIVPSHYVPLAAPGAVAQALRWMWNPRSPLYVKPRISWELLTWSWRFQAACTPAHVARAAPLLAQLNLASRRAHEELAEEFGANFELARTGLLMLCKTERALAEEAHTARMAEQLGMEAQVLDASQTSAVDPAVAMNVIGSVYYPRDCSFSPKHFMGHLQSRLEADGVEFLWDTLVTDWQHNGSRIRAAVTSRGESTADAFVLSSGAWSSGLAKRLGLRLPLQAGKGYTLTLEDARHVPRVTSICAEARIAVTPMGGSVRFGGTMEIAGLDPRITARRVRQIVESVPKYFPQFQEADFANVLPWAGLRPCSPDGLPYLGRSRVAENLVIATGHGMMGMSMGPITGQLVAGLLADEPPQLDIRPLSPDR